MQKYTFVPYSAIINKYLLSDVRALARLISLVENEVPNYLSILKTIPARTDVPIIGITGPPGAGKSTLVNALLKNLTDKNLKVGVLAVDPSSPFGSGALLGDRIRMSHYFNHPNVFIRSLATRGWLGGLSAKAIEVADVMRGFGFDYIIIETVGVGQSEVEIVQLADITAVVLVPEAGDEIQGIKAGLMEIADVFIVNKADRAGSAAFAGNLRKMIAERHSLNNNVAVQLTVASKNEGIDEVLESLENALSHKRNTKNAHFIFEKTKRIIAAQLAMRIDIEALKAHISQAGASTNVYALAEAFLEKMK